MEICAGQSMDIKLMKINTKSVRFKIIIYTAICVTVVSIVGNLYLYSCLNNIIIEKTKSIDRIYLDSLKIKIEDSFEDLIDICVLCANQYDISKAMKNSTIDTLSKKKEMLQAQKVMNNYLNSTKMNSYVNKMMIFNEKGIVVQASAKNYTSQYDVQNVIRKEFAQGKEIDNRKASFRLGESITPYEKDNFSIILKVNTISARVPEAYLYMEVETGIIEDIILPFTKLNHIFAANESSKEFIASKNESLDFIKMLLQKTEAKEKAEIEGQLYQLDKRRLSNSDAVLYSYTNISNLLIEDDNMSFTLVMVLLSNVVISMGITIIISKWITRPISRLIRRLHKIAENDFSYDPAIEQSHDEIGEIGKAVNEMVCSVDNLMKETIRVHEAKAKAEIAMLQAQVNPHFLYNTLDSVHWMAVIQKCPGISNITKSLSNLLKNMVKGVSDKITLREELSLLRDYVTIQSIRYVETFEAVYQIPEEFYDYKIVKLTLQPIVENAIFHGIEPAGRFGTIEVRAEEEAEFLYLVVEDNGAGMTEDQIEALLKNTSHSRESTMSGIGVSNVDKRLKLIYGPECGLRVESEKGRYTKVTIKIRKEQ